MHNNWPCRPLLTTGSVSNGHTLDSSDMDKMSTSVAAPSPVPPVSDMSTATPLSNIEAGVDSGKIIPLTGFAFWWKVFRNLLCWKVNGDQDDIFRTSQDYWFSKHTVIFWKAEKHESKRYWIWSPSRWC